MTDFKRQVYFYLMLLQKFKYIPLNFIQTNLLEWIKILKPSQTTEEAESYF